MRIVVVSNERFTVTQDMLEMDEKIVQRPIKDVEHMELVMEKIPTKELYGLKASVMQEVQDRARLDATNLEIGREVKEIIQVTCEQITLENEEDKKRANNLEKNITKVYKSIPDYM
jgi:hypothetical protein